MISGAAMLWPWAMELVVTSRALAAMRAHARAAHPQEACGLLLGAMGEGAARASISEARPTANVHPSPRTHFEIDPAALIAAHRAARVPGAPTLIGYYHAHPAGAAVPSATDRALAARDGRVWAIIAADEVRFWHDLPHGFVALSFGIRDV
ncbi:M67 family metallopeptidase [Erythrobacter cryptus]|uniref:M67 family metallopeptidase n=1 Tax=Erythrobacter cryptus TaxID=196588 RepID=UPI001FDFD367|nr:M67 family metallopeptidase [Erythrobacter cryptus]